MKQQKTKFAGFDPATDPKQGMPKQADQLPSSPKFGNVSNDQAGRAVRIAEGKDK